MQGESPELEALPSLNAATVAAAAGDTTPFQLAQEQLRAQGQRRRLEQTSGGLPYADAGETEARTLREARVAFSEPFQTQAPQIGQSAQVFAPQGAPHFFGGPREEHAQDARIAEELVSSRQQVDQLLKTLLEEDGRSSTNSSPRWRGWLRS